jgi:hypothetical protein
MAVRRRRGARASMWPSLLVANPIVPTDLERCREAEPGRLQMLKVAEADQARLCSCEAAPGVPANRSPNSLVFPQLLACGWCGRSRS